MTIRLVSWKNPTAIEMNEGITIRSASGRMTSRMAGHQPSPSAFAASMRPGGTICRPERTASARYADANSATAPCTSSSLSSVMAGGSASGKTSTAR